MDITKEIIGRYNCIKTLSHYFNYIHFRIAVIKLAHITLLGLIMLVETTA